MNKNNFKEVFSKYAGKHWVIALSGGADSRYLLELADNYRDFAKSLCAVYVNHHLQDCAKDWEKFCAGECKKLGITFYVEHVEVSRQGSIEANAREARYKALSTHIDEHSVLFTAHHADDLLETLLLAVLRGSGLDGLSVMPAERKFGRGILARPLLNTGRAEIEARCHEEGLMYVTDPSNSDTEYDRNFLRHEIVPCLKQRFPMVLGSAKHTAQNLGSTRLVYEGLLVEKIRPCITDVWGIKGLDLELARAQAVEQEQPDVYMSELVRFFYKSIYGIILNRSRLTELAGFSRLSSDNHASFVIDGIRVFIYGGIALAVPDTEPLKGRKLELHAGERKSIADFCISLEQVTSEACKLSSSYDCRRWYFNAPVEASLFELEFAPPSSCRLHPETRNHSQILKMLWKEYKVPLFLRPACPLVTFKGEKLGLAGVFACQHELLDKKDKDKGKGIRLKLEIKWLAANARCQ